MEKEYKEEKFDFMVYQNKSEYDKILEKVKMIPNNWSPERILKKIRKEFSLSMMLGMGLKAEDFPIYRVRSIAPSEKINEFDVQSFSYPPKPSSVKMGRANRSRQQVFYASADHHTPFKEMADQIEVNKSIVYLSKWGIKDHPEQIIARNFFLGIPEDKKDNHASIMAKGLSDKLHTWLEEMEPGMRENFIYGQAKCAEIFTEKGKKYYYISSALAYDTFVRAAKQNVQIPVITYPSVAKDKSAVNFAFRKDFVDKFLYLKEVDKVIVTKLDEDGISYTPISRGVVKNDRIEWFNVQLNIERIAYENALISHSKKMENFRPLAEEELLTICCNKHTMTIREYLNKNGITDQFIREGIQTYPINMDDYKLKQDYNFFFITETTGKVFLSNNISDSGIIKYIWVPILFSINFELESIENS